MLRLALVLLALNTSSTALAQIGIGEPERNIFRSLEPLDKSHSINQRTDIKQRFIGIGYNLKTAEADIPILQRMLTLGQVQRNDLATLQAMGVVLGDIMAQRLDMDWVIVHDKHGRSRALRYRETNIVIFPVTMISRRYKTGLNVDIQALYDKAVTNAEARIRKNATERKKSWR